VTVAHVSDAPPNWGLLNNAPRLPIHQGIRRGLHRRRHSDPHQSTRSTPGERDLRADDWNPAPRNCSTGSSSVKVLIKQIRHYITHWNSSAKPFVWTATANEILAKVRLAEANIKKLVDNNAK
jgi:hypothetical protein